MNPVHLFLGTDVDNVADKVAKGRQYRSIGELHPGAKVTEPQVAEIRSIDPAVSHNAVGRKYGLSASCVSQIRRRLTWRHLP